MSFRHKADREWREWLLKHRDRLIAMGIPREIWANRLTWQVFLQEGSQIDRKSKWRFSLEYLNESQQRQLFEFLREFSYWEQFSLAVWSDLHRRFGNPGELPY